MSFHMLSYSLESPVSLSERGLDSSTPSPLDRRQLRSVMEEFFSFHLIMRHDEKYVQWNLDLTNLYVTKSSI